MSLGSFLPSGIYRGLPGLKFPRALARALASLVWTLWGCVKSLPLPTFHKRLMKPHRGHDLLALTLVSTAPGLQRKVKGSGCIFGAKEREPRFGGGGVDEGAP